MLLKTSIDQLSMFLNPLRVIYSETCTIGNVTANWLGMNTLIYHGTLGTFTDREKVFIEQKNRAAGK
jgi:hypothetical protein